MKTDWFRESGYGMMMHFIPGNDGEMPARDVFAAIDAFDVPHLADQVVAAGAGHFLFTLGQNGGFFNAPNPVYEELAGYRPGERCSERDLPMEIIEALAARNVKTMLYLPGEAPFQDTQAQERFGLPPERGVDRPVNEAACERWARVIEFWADRYGRGVAGWWFDGTRADVGFDDAMFQLYAEACRHGNPETIVAFNPGLRVPMLPYTVHDDYLAGEVNDPMDCYAIGLDHPYGPGGDRGRGKIRGTLEAPMDILPPPRPNHPMFGERLQWHALTYLGEFWGRREPRYSAERWAGWVAEAIARGGVATLDVGPNEDPTAGPVGAISDAMMTCLEHIRRRVRLSRDSHANRQ